MAASCGGSTTDGGCPVILPCPYPGFDVDTCSCRKAEGGASASPDASYAVVDGGLVLTGCPVGPNTGPFNVDMAHGGAPPTGSCDPGSTCRLTTEEQCSGGFQGGSSQWSCTCSAGSWSCTLTGQRPGICPPVVHCGDSIRGPDEYCSSFGRCCPMGALCVSEIVDEAGE